MVTDYQPVGRDKRRRKGAKRWRKKTERMNSRQASSSLLYLAKFSDVTGLYRDSRVLYNGVYVGRVKTIIPTHEFVKDVRQPIIWVGIFIFDQDIELRSNDAATIVTDITGVSTLLIQSNPGEAETIKGVTKPPWREAFDADAFVKEHGFLEGKTPASLGVLQDKLNEILGNVRDLVNSVAGEQEKESLGNIITNLEDATKNASETFGSFNSIIQEHKPRFDSIIQNADKTFASLAETIDTNRQPVTDLVADAKVAAANLREASEGIKEVAKGLPDTGRLVDEKINALANRATAVLTSLETGARAVLDNFVLAGANFAETAERTRRAPWLLLYTPTKEDMELVNLYDAARNLANAQRAARVLIDRLDAVAGRETEGTEQLDAVIADVRRRLEAIDQAIKQSTQDVHEKASELQ